MKDQEPRLITARFEGKCAKCNGKIDPFSPIIHYSEAKLTYHIGCGRQAYMDFWGSRLYTASAACNAIQKLI